MKIEEFYDNLPYRVKEDAGLPTNYSRMTFSQQRLVANLFDYEGRTEKHRNHMEDVMAEAEVLAYETRLIAENLANMCTEMKLPPLDRE